MLNIIITFIAMGFYVFRDDLKISKPLTMLYVFPIFISIRIIQQNFNGNLAIGVPFLIFSSLLTIGIIDKPAIFSIYKNLQYTFLQEFSHIISLMIIRNITYFALNVGQIYGIVLVVVFAIVLVITKIFEKRDKLNSVPQKINLIIGIIVMLVGILYLYKYISVSFIYDRGFDDFSVLLIFTLFFCLMVYIQELSKIVRYLDIIDDLQGQLKLQLEHYNSFERYIETTRRFRHDIKNHNFLILTLIKKGDFGGAIGYINSLTDNIFDIPYKQVTNNKIIDAVMIGAIEKAKNLSIDFEYKINNVQDLNIEDIDLSSVFSNILNNAIEACERMPINNRKINLIANSRSNVLALEISNTYNGLIAKEGSSFKTLKANNRDHGIGMVNLKEIVKKYNGIFDVDYDDKIFKISITLFSKDN